MASAGTSLAFSAVSNRVLQPRRCYDLSKSLLPPHNHRANCCNRHRRNEQSYNKLCSLPDAPMVAEPWGEKDYSYSVSSRPEPREEASTYMFSNFFAANSLKRRGFVFMTLLPQLLFHTAGSEAFADESDEGSIIRQEVRKVLSKAKAAGMLRLVFHDAGTFDMKENSGGMNGSIIYELDRVENAGLTKSVKILDKSKKELDRVLSVSWADLIAIAGTEAVSLCGGPFIPVKTGRRDSRIPDPLDRLPQESLDAEGLKKCFLKKGFSTQELVALSGAHTLGNKGFGNPFIFDNTYYNVLLEKPWTTAAGMSSMIGLPSDRALLEDEECLRWIKTYASDQASFFDDFSHAYTKLVNSGASWN